MSWIDTHCHLDAIEVPLAEVVAEAARAGVDRIITVGTDLETSAAAIHMSDSADVVWAVVGIHPHDASTFNRRARDVLAQLARGPKVVGIGETGLDFYRNLSAPEEQRAAFVEQVALAKQLDKTLVIHMRDAHEEVYGVLKEVGAPERLVFHCFSGGPEEARAALDLGGHLSFAGNISYRNAETLRDAARVAPLDRILVETDSPYLAPVPHRGKPNRPALVALVGSALASALGRPEDEIAEMTSGNARRVFRMA